MSCLALFAFPCLVLGAVSPCIVKVAVKDLESNGRVSGEIYGLSTLGSIIGTFVPTFATIPIIGTAKTFFLFAGILCLLSLGNSFRLKAGLKRPFTLILIIGGLSLIPGFASVAFWDQPLLESESVYNYLLVKKDAVAVTLSTHVMAGIQSIYQPRLPLTRLYYDLAVLGNLFFSSEIRAKPYDALVLGFATGTFAKLCRRYFPQCRIDGVEIDPAIVALGRRYFALTDDDARVLVDDGRMFLAKTERKYKIVFLDAFQDITYPFHMATREFFELVLKHMDDDGLLVINVNLHSSVQPDLCTYIERTVKGVLPYVYRASHPDYHNKIIFAFRGENNMACFRQNSKYSAGDHILSKIAQEMGKEMVQVTESKPCFTDDLAPIEFLGFQAMNQFIRDVFRESSVRAVYLLKDHF